MKIKKISAVLTAAAAALSMLATPTSAVFYDSYDSGNGTVYYDNYNYNNGTVYYDNYSGNYYDSNGVPYYSNGHDGYFYNGNNNTTTTTNNGYTIYYDTNTGKYYDSYGNVITYDSYGNAIVYDTYKGTTNKTKQTTQAKSGGTEKKKTSTTKKSAYYYAARSELGDFPYVKHSYVYQRTTNNSRKKIDQYKFSDGYGNTITVRRAAGNRDVSGNTTTYSRSTKAKIGNSYVKIKGSKNGYYLAIWVRNGYAYSVKSNYAMSLDDIEDVVVDVMNGYVF